MDELGNIQRVALVTEQLRPEWHVATYQATMPGNVEAYLFALFGGLF